eukprot:9240863-Alexandrium_andersonii.AAC.1
MSASLVGSEMCIRDRLLNAFLPTAVAVAADAGRCSLAWCPAQSQLSTAVSYTHLTLPTICSV